MALVRADTTIGELVPVFDPNAPPSVERQLAVLFVTTEPPLSDGAAKVTVILAAP